MLVVLNPCLSAVEVLSVSAPLREKFLSFVPGMLISRQGLAVCLNFMLR